MRKSSKGFLGLGIGLAVIYGMMFYVMPTVIDVIPPFKVYADELERQGITGSALFYTDVQQARDAQDFMRERLRPNT